MHHLDNRAMIIKEDLQFDANDLESVKSRLNEQSELILLLKDHADQEMQTAREYEFRLAQQEDRNSELQEEISELRERLSQAQLRVATLSQTIDTLNIDLLNAKAHRISFHNGVDVGVSCNAPELKPKIDNFVQTTKQRDEIKIVRKLWEADLQKADVQIRHYQNENRQLQDKLQLAKVSLNTTVVDLQKSLNSLQEQCQEKTEECQKLRFEKMQLAETLSSKEIEINRIMQKSSVTLCEIEAKWQKSETTLREELNALKALRREEIDKFNANKQIQCMQNQLDETNERYNLLQNDFQAYKVYAKELLEAEKRINRKLRQAYH